MSMSTSTCGSQGDGEFKVRAEEGARETLLKRDSREFEETQDYMDDVPSSPRRFQHRPPPARYEDPLPGPSGGSQRGPVMREDSSPEERPQARMKTASRMVSLKMDSFDIAGKSYP